MDVVSVLVISGSMGAGKTTVMNEVTDLLAAQGSMRLSIWMHSASCISRLVRQLMI